jgi:hypothetical protein
MPPWRATQRAGGGEAAGTLPEWVAPQLTKLVDQPPDGPEWLRTSEEWPIVITIPLPEYSLSTPSRW